MPSEARPVKLPEKQTSELSPAGPKTPKSIKSFRFGPLPVMTSPQLIRLAAMVVDIKKRHVSLSDDIWLIVTSYHRPVKNKAWNQSFHKNIYFWLSLRSATIGTLIYNIYILSYHIIHFDIIRLINEYVNCLAVWDRKLKKRQRITCFIFKNL